MKRTLRFSFLILLILPLAALSCRHAKPEKIVRPVKVIAIEAGGAGVKVFPGWAESSEYTYLNFRVGGLLEQLDADEGRLVRRGDPVGRIDPRDYRLRVSATEAAFRQTELQLDRYRTLYARQAISRQEYEMTQAAYENDKAAYQKALNDLRDTHLVAPFDGSIEAKYVEAFQQVTPGERIAKLVNPAKLRFRFTLPEGLARSLTDSTRWGVSFAPDGGRYYRARLDEVFPASVGGGGIPVTVVIDERGFDPRAQKILPGYACHIRMEVPPGADPGVVVPLSAIYTDPAGGQTAVWRVARDSTVRRTPVETGPLSGESGIVVHSGLAPGDRIVTAGVTLLSEGEKVHILGEERP